TRLASLVAVNVEFRTVSLSEPIRGRDAFRQVTERYLRALPDFRIENRAVAFTDDTVAVEWRVTGTHDAPLLVELRVTGARGRLTELPRTGRRVDIPGCSVLRVDAAGLIAAVDEYWNQASMLPQLGIRPFAVGVLRQGLSRLSR
ncbi:MAG: ester cyclase, partial [Actinomycetota bacterium]|nr:ester cyclase [Actinomycetota bacterium]